MNTKTLLVIIALLLAGILGFMIYDHQKQTPAEKFEAGLHDAADGLGDAIKDFGGDLKKQNR